MYELDPDVVRWNLHLLDFCSLGNNCSPQTITGYEKESSTTESVKEDFCNTTHASVENDEVIARALQEELSKLAAAEASVSVSSGQQHQQASVLAQDWCGPSRRHLNSERQNKREEVVTNEASFLELEESSVEREDRDLLPEIEDESALDGELGKRINQMVPIPHVPKINGEIPSVDEATSDHERLLNRLQLYDLVELKILGDGNCQFRSLSDQIYRSAEHHKFVREQVVNQLKLRADLYENYVPMAYNDYLQKMSKNGEWGDHITLQAASDWFGVKIFVITSFKDTCYIEILPQIQKSNRIIFLSFWAEVHYNSIYPLGELPMVETRKKKRWWWC
ncbi:OTU (ovarian tumor)-like cysteine protease [Handroanthus impetiginosus]|uniref:ubiquitinyl hydrolase 1 n=1 Tax=Handroanthus impetiginosus TaxID=429701 RepID=A0A2G9GDT5_9LAMI|nr:OTU (ovarian tumor)-like cysteine protease [Handroanthus impetiginosus]